MQFTIKHRFKTDVEVFWDKVFFDEEYNRSLFVDYLNFSVFNVLSFEKHSNGVIQRRLELAPKVEVPKAVKRVLGSSVNYIEEGKFDPDAKSWMFKIHPQMGSQTIKTHGKLWTEPCGDRELERICSINTEVKIFGIGRMVEEMIEKQTRVSYDRAAEFTDQWIRDRGL